MYPGPAFSNTAYSGYLSGSTATDDPFYRDNDVATMSDGWRIMEAVTNGSDWIRLNAPIYLPQEPREDEEAWKARIRRSVLSPFTIRIIENAAGLVLRRPIRVIGDDYWQDFARNVDGLGSSLNEYARRAMISTLTYGHSAILVDYPKDPGALTLAEERALSRRPYFNHIDAPQIWGWRQENTLPSAPLSQVRIYQVITRPAGKFGEDKIEQMTVIYPGRFETYERGEGTPEENVVTSGTLSIEEIPLVPIYASREGMLLSKPPLQDIASLNITHYQRQADLIHALHIAAMPTLVLEGWDEEASSASVGPNYGISMEPGNKAYYIQSDASSFASQSAEIEQLEQQMATLGVTKLLGQKFVGESADAKRVDQAQANSVLAILSLELESALNEAFALAAAYLGVEAPRVVLDREFDFYRLIGQDVAVLNDINARGGLSDETFLRVLQRGEVLPDNLNIEEEAAITQRLREERNATPESRPE